MGLFKNIKNLFKKEIVDERQKEEVKNVLKKVENKETSKDKEIKLYEKGLSKSIV